MQSTACKLSALHLYNKRELLQELSLLTLFDVVLIGFVVPPPL